MHQENHPLMNQVAKIAETATHPQVNNFGGSNYLVEDWWDRITGKDWRSSAAQGNPAAIIYQMRVRANELPVDNEVVYGKINGMGHLVHVSELLELTEEDVA